LLGHLDIRSNVQTFPLVLFCYNSCLTNFGLLSPSLLSLNVEIVVIAGAHAHWQFHTVRV